MQFATRVTTLGCVLFLVTGCGSTGDPTVTIASGMLEGSPIEDGGAVFRGVPYAQAPVADLRWRPPVPVEAWEGVREANEKRPACAQIDMGWNALPAADSSEDCLYLNVWTPDISPDEPLPVMVWYHGGGFTGGAGGEALFDGEHIISRGVLLVTVNYRLGALGFLAHPELTAESADASSGNYGLRDQVAALTWVRDNISEFGGDPDNITIFGQSAGGGSVMNLLASPMSRDIPRQAIVQSGVALRGMSAPTLTDAEAIGLRFAEGAGIADMRAMPVEQVLERFAAFQQGGPDNAVRPIIDGTVLEESPLSAFAAGRESGAALIVGSNQREGLGRVTDDEVPGVIEREFGSQAARALALYQAEYQAEADDPAAGTTAERLMTDITFRCGAVIAAQRHAANGRVVYHYQFDQWLPGREAEGAQHSYELPFVFGTFQRDAFLGGDFSEADRALSDTMIDYWTNFARTRNPNGEGLPEWPAFDGERSAYARFSTAYDNMVDVDAGLRREICEAYLQGQS